MATYEDIVKANESIRTTDIKGKAYAEVNERIKAFRMVYPEGCIKTEMISCVNDVCVFKAEVYSHLPCEDECEGYEDWLLATGHAYEKEGSSFINKTSYIENCETSAVGRALGIAGFGIDTSVASFEEVANAQKNQNKEVKEQDRPRLVTEITNIIGQWGIDPIKVYEKVGVENLNEITTDRLPGMIDWLNGLDEKTRKGLM